MCLGLEDRTDVVLATERRTRDVTFKVNRIDRSVEEHVRATKPGMYYLDAVMTGNKKRGGGVDE
jgi:hypothetical protein